MWQQWGSGHEKDLLDEAIAQYEKEHSNIKINEEPVTDDTKMLSSISGGDAPDIIDLGTTTNIGAWAEQGALMCLDDFMAKDNINKDDFIPASWKAVTYKDKIYAMPFVAFNAGLLWNKELFKEAGLDPETPPKTMEELAKFAEKLTKVDANGNITQMGFVPNWPISNLTNNYIFSFGGKVIDDENNKITLDDPAVAKALEWERSFYTKYGSQNVQNFTSSTGEWLTAQDAFESGKLAMVIDGSWAIRFIQENVPDVDKNIGAALIPSSADHPELYGTGFIDVNPQIIPTGAKHPKEAWDFIKWLTTDKKICATFADGTANIPQLKDVPAEGILKDERFKTFIEAASSDKAQVGSQISNSSECYTKLGDLENQILLDPKIDINKALKDLNEELNAELK
jgi:multiple sugar transport system substrate-binding protein